MCKIGYWGFIIVFFIFPLASSLTVGSNTAVSRQSRPTFPTAATDNVMLGFAFFENGFLLADQATTCTFDNFFPVRGSFLFNQGRLFLTKDFNTGSNFLFQGGGRITGNLYAFSSGKTLSELVIPDPTIPLFSLKTQSAELANVLSVDASFNNVYVASGLNTNSGQEIKVYYFDGQTLTVTAQLEFGVAVSAVRWHPSLLYLAYAKANAGALANEVGIARLNNSNGSFSVTGGVDTGRAASALAWHTSGNFLVSGEASGGTAEIRLYSFNNGTGVLSQIGVTDLNPNRNVQRGAMSFGPGGNLLAVGTAAQSTAQTLLIYRFNGSTLASQTGLNVGSTVLGLDWSPTGTYIAVGLSSGTNRLRVYKYNSSLNSLTEATTARVGESFAVNSVSWDKTGTYLIVGISNSTSSRFDIYFFDSLTETLTRIRSFSSTAAVNDARWFPDQSYIVTGDSISRTSIYSTTPNVSLFENVTLTFDTPVTVNQTWKFLGSCAINAHGNKVIFQNGSNLEVASRASLRLEMVDLIGLAGNNVRCLDNTGTITLNNAILKLSSDFTFSRGAMLFQGDVAITGSVKFVYQTSMTSTIDTQSMLTIDREVTFSYAPLRASKLLLSFGDDSSSLYLNDASLFMTRTGLRLTQGNIFVDNHVTVSSQARSMAEGFEVSQNVNFRLLGFSSLDIFGKMRVL